MSGYVAGFDCISLAVLLLLLWNGGGLYILQPVASGIGIEFGALDGSFVEVSI